MVPANDLSRALPWHTEERAALTSAAQSGIYFGGPFTCAFEKTFSQEIGVDHCVGVASGTDALTLSLAALGVGPGSLVATTANAGFYSSTAILRLGATPVYVDICAETAMMDPDSLGEILALTSASVTVLTHMYGGMAAVGEVLQTCEQFGSRLVEDCAHSIGARVAAGAAGTFGDLAAFSFYPTKNLGAMGDAGAVLGMDEELVQRVRSLAQYGWTNTRFVVDERGGTNSRLDELQAAVLGVRLEHLSAQNVRRRSILRQYREALKPFPIRLLFDDSPAHVGHLAVLVCDRRDEMRDTLHSRGVTTQIHYPVADHEQPIMSGFVNPRPLPMTEYLTRNILTVPAFPTMTDEEVDKVCAALTEAAMLLAEQPDDVTGVARGPEHSHRSATMRRP